MIILGVDPGSLRTGYGVIETDGRRHVLVEKGVIAPAAALGLAERLHFIHRGIVEVIARIHPDALAVEDLFHAANTRSALVLGHVRGAVLLAGAAAGVPVSAFAPATVKVQVAMMVARLLGLEGDGEAGDAADALAVALCHAHLHGIGPAAPAAPRRSTGIS